MLDTSQLKPAAWERQYLEDIFSHLPEIKAVAYHFKPDNPKQSPPKVDDDTVLLMISEEFSLPSPKVPCRLFCRQYARPDESSVFQLPLGIMNGFPNLTPKRWSERLFDVSFVGTYHTVRGKLVNQIIQHPSLSSRKLYFRNAPLPITAYAEIMNDSKLVVCLPGEYSPETFRFFEAVRVGCIAIVPGFVAGWVYDNIGDAAICLHPFTSDTIAVAINNVLDGPQLQAEILSANAIKLWFDRYTPETVAARLFQRLS